MNGCLIAQRKPLNGCVLVSHRSELEGSNLDGAPSPSLPEWLLDQRPDIRGGELTQTAESKYPRGRVHSRSSSENPD